MICLPLVESNDENHDIISSYIGLRMELSLRIFGVLQ
jgi:hypothetical protein